MSAIGPDISEIEEEEEEEEEDEEEEEEEGEGGLVMRKRSNTIAGVRLEAATHSRAKSDITDILQRMRKENKDVPPSPLPSPAAAPLAAEGSFDPREDVFTPSFARAQEMEEEEEEEEEEEGIGGIFPIDIEMHVTINVDYGKISLRTEER